LAIVKLFKNFGKPDKVSEIFLSLSLDSAMSQNISEMADTIGRRVNWLIERCCALLMAVMVLVVWFGVTERYFLRIGITWTEEFSRYVMIWVALLAISCAAYRREHIGLILLIQRLSGTRRRMLQCSLDLVGLVFLSSWLFTGST